MTTLTIQVPRMMKAVVTTAEKTIALEEVPVPEIDDDEILVKTTALAQNPTDWKYVKFIGNPSTIVGVDFAGVVVKVGSAVTAPSVGTKVAGFVHGGQYKDRGAFAEYVKTAAELVWEVPESSTSDVEAAAMGCGAWTAVQTLFHPTRLGLVEPPDRTPGEEWVFIYGGSTSVGMYAIQLAHFAGYKVATVASPNHHDLLRSYGADLILDYRDPTAAIAKIKETTGNSIHHALDAVSSPDTQIFTVKTFAPGRAKLLVIVHISPEAQALRPDVEFEHFILYTTHGRAFGTYPARPDDKKHMTRFLKKFPELVKSGALKSNPTKLFEGGLEGISDGFEYMIAGKVSGEKIVYEV
ncbi:GroES-like protein [Cristinia sonorae]|uniref:GroES-like protein n=1 Tax=Cristinia sonorae TaxID=1940300 RepID=A0A8K0USX7_9AGAR|nr:GroES-like protein [Cristinia sonorae]